MVVINWEPEGRPLSGTCGLIPRDDGRAFQLRRQQARWHEQRARPGMTNRGAITVSIMLAVIMRGLDNTIANVALPHMQGSLSASREEIGWVLTSYIVSVAITMPLAGWLAGRVGIKYIYLY